MTDVRLAELVAALSLATDLGMGQPMDHALRTCVLAVDAGRALGLNPDELRDVYYLSLLRFVGCTSDAHEEAARVGGDDIAFRHDVAPVVMGSMPEFMGHVVRHLGEDRGPLARTRLVAGFLAGGQKTFNVQLDTHCEVGRMLADRLGLPPTVMHGLQHLFERWDGKGLPDKLAGEAIPSVARIVSVARDVEVFARAASVDGAVDNLRRRRAAAYDPAVCDYFLDHGRRLLDALDAGDAWEIALEREPAPRVRLDGLRLDDALEAFGEFADLKSPFTRGHSGGVAALASCAGGALGCDAGTLRRAGLVHDLGRSGVPNGIWDKPGPLAAHEWERVRLHSYYTERVLARCAPMRELASLAGSHHERLDGSGYAHGRRAAELGREARVLAAADVCQALVSARPHRPASSPSAAAAILRGEVEAGRLDDASVRAVLDAAGAPVVRPRTELPAGLSEREVEVLRLISAGGTNRAVAAALRISPKTVGRHIENIYAKTGVSTRAGAALFAMRHELLHAMG